MTNDASSTAYCPQKVAHRLTCRIRKYSTPMSRSSIPDVPILRPVRRDSHRASQMPPLTTSNAAMKSPITPNHMVLNLLGKLRKVNYADVAAHVQVCVYAPVSACRSGCPCAAGGIAQKNTARR